MAKERKIICDCGHGFEEVTDVFDGIKAKVLRYPNCGYTTFSLEQAKEFVKLKEMRKLVKQERKIIKIGNSKGLTIPEFLKVKVGQKAKIEILSQNSFKVILKKKIY